MLEKAKKWSLNTRCSYISRFSALLAVKTTIMKSLGYPLAALTLTEKQCDRIMLPIKKWTLPKMGIVRNISKTYLYGPRAVQGS